MTTDDPDKRPRRRFLGSVAAAAITALAGCGLGPGADAAYYHATGPALDVDYDAVVDAARDADYSVDGPYYVGTKEPSVGFHPTGIAELDDLLGPDYRVFGVTVYYTQQVFLECWFSSTPTVSLFDDRLVGEAFDVTSFPPEAWLVRNLTLAFEMEPSRAREYVGSLEAAVADGTDSPSVEVTESPTFPRTYESLSDQATSSTASDSYGDGWYELTLVRESERLAAIDFVVQSTKVVHRQGEHVYTLKLDRLGGFNLTIELPPQERIPEEEYRAVFREMFTTVGLPPEVVDDLTFEYTPTVW